MDQIAQQLKTEIESLQEYIQRTEERLQVVGWVSELLDPFESLEDDLSRTELEKMVTGLFHAKFRFGVNGHLSNRIDVILQRHEDLVAGLQGEGMDSSASLPAKDPETYADPESIPEEDDEEASFPVGTDAETSFEPLAFEDESDGSASGLSLFQAPDLDDEPVPRQRDEGGDEVDSLFLDDDSEDTDDGSASGLSLFQAPDLDDDLADTREALPSVHPSPTSAPESESDIPAEDLSELFDQSGSDGQQDGASQSPSPTSSPAPQEDVADLFAPGDSAAPSHRDDTQENGQSVGDLFATSQEESKQSQQRSSASQKSRPLPPSQRKEQGADRHRLASPRSGESSDIDIFAAKVSIENLLLRLGISIPAQDKAQLQTLLHHKIADRVIPALKANPNYEKTFILVPRLSRFVHDGKLVPCTVKNLAKTFITLFGNIQDLMHYRSQHFFHTEVPPLGWALVGSEAPQATLNKNFMEQTQYIRYLAANIGIPSHLVRRRLLVESVYDIIVGRMVLGNPLQRSTLDWTSSGPSKSDFVCVYFSDNGIRMRDLPRTTHNRALGTVPTW